ncbi:MAG: lyase family protein [Methanobacteriota archaeon]
MHSISISPNDHVNLAQSTNDTYPTASHIAIISGADRLKYVLQELRKTFQKKGVEYTDLPKTGRTHLMDAVPVRLGDEFFAYATAIMRSSEQISQRRDDLLEVAIGGTDTGRIEYILCIS